MRRIILSAGIAAAALAFAAPASASDGAQQPVTVITAMSQGRAQHGWLEVRAPDASGRYLAQVSFADLDLTSPAGWSAAQARVGHATRDVCDMLASDPEFPGYDAVDKTDCAAAIGQSLRSRLETVRANTMGAEVRPALAAL